MQSEYKNEIICNFLKSRNRRVNPKLIGRHLGQGTEGDVFAYDKNKIIKITSCLSKKSARIIINKVRYLKKINSKHVAKIYDYGFFSSSNNVIAYYITERLFCINNNECGGFSGFDKKWNWDNENCLISFGKLYYDDWCNCNVMKTKRGVQKICDLNGFEWDIATVNKKF